MMGDPPLLRAGAAIPLVNCQKNPCVRANLWRVLSLNAVFHFENLMRKSLGVVSLIAAYCLLALNLIHTCNIKDL